MSDKLRLGGFHLRREVGVCSLLGSCFEFQQDLPQIKTLDDFAIEAQFVALPDNTAEARAAYRSKVIDVEPFFTTSQDVHFIVSTARRVSPAAVTHRRDCRSGMTIRSLSLRFTVVAVPGGDAIWAFPWRLRRERFACELATPGISGRLKKKPFGSDRSTW